MLEQVKLAKANRFCSSYLLSVLRRSRCYGLQFFIVRMPAIVIVLSHFSIAYSIYRLISGLMCVCVCVCGCVCVCACVCLCVCVCVVEWGWGQFFVSVHFPV